MIGQEVELTGHVVAVTVMSYPRSEESPVAAGSPYYGKAVQEAIAGLRNPGAKAVLQARPALRLSAKWPDTGGCQAIGRMRSMSDIVT